VWLRFSGKINQPRAIGQRGEISSTCPRGGDLFDLPRDSCAMISVGHKLLGDLISYRHYDCFFNSDCISNISLRWRIYGSSKRKLSLRIGGVLNLAFAGFVTATCAQE